MVTQHPTGQSVAATLARIEVKLDQVLALVADHELRLRRVERQLYRAAGAAGLAGVLSGLLLPQLFDR